MDGHRYRPSIFGKAVILAARCGSPGRWATIILVNARAVQPHPSRHYENFPVASWLCPRPLRPAVAAIYWFARTADDIADEGDASSAERLTALAQYRTDLDAVLRQPQAATARPEVFAPLGRSIHEHRLPASLLHDLLDAFEQDARMSGSRSWYRDRAELLDYCRRSANPIGRLLLHLYRVHDAQRLAQSDHICSALQLINFWQDLSIDIPRRRYYLPLDRCAQFGVSLQELEQQADTPGTGRLIESEAQWAREMMLMGEPLARRLPGRIGLELRLVIQGGLRILDKIASLKHQTLRRRPRLRPWDLLPMAWRSLLM